VNGIVESVVFSNLGAPGGSAQSMVPPMDTFVMRDGAIYNDLEDTELLSVTYLVPPSGSSASSIAETPYVPQGEDTGGVFSGEVMYISIKSATGEIVKYNPTKPVVNTPGLPVLVWKQIILTTPPPTIVYDLVVFRTEGPPQVVAFKIAT